MRIIERRLRQIIHEEVGRVTDADANPSDDEGMLVTDFAGVQTESARRRNRWRLEF